MTVFQVEDIASFGFYGRGIIGEKYELLQLPS